MPYTPEEQLVLDAFGKRVKAARKARKWTQIVLAEHADLDRSYVGAIERGEQGAGLVIINKLALALDESFEGFLPWSPPPDMAALQEH